MKQVLLDTNAYSELLKGDERVLDEIGEAGKVYMSIFVLGELFYGFKGGQRELQNRDYLKVFLSKHPVRIYFSIQNSLIMNHQISHEDFEYLLLFERCKLKPERFHHREHIKIAYILLTMFSVEEALVRLKSDLIAYLDFIRVDKSKYHKTMTCAWLLAVNHFMHMSHPAASSDEFIELNDILLNKDIMYTHYSQALLESKEARISFVQPDLDPIPRY